MSLDIIQWNISYNSKVDKVSSYLKSQISDNCVVCLQEVLESSKQKILNHLHPTDYRYSLDIRPPGKFDGKNRKLGLLTMTFGNKITMAALLLNFQKQFDRYIEIMTQCIYLLKNRVGNEVKIKKKVLKSQLDKKEQIKR